MTERIFKVKVRGQGSVLLSSEVWQFLIVTANIDDVPKKVKALMKKLGRPMRRITSIKDLGQRDA